MKNRTPSVVLYDKGRNLFSIKAAAVGKGIPEFTGTGEECRHYVKEAQNVVLGWVVEWEKDTGPWPMKMGDGVCPEGSWTMYPTMEEAYNEYYEGGE